MATMAQAPKRDHADQEWSGPKPGQAPWTISVPQRSKAWPDWFYFGTQASWVFCSNRKIKAHALILRPTKPWNDARQSGTTGGTIENCACQPFQVVSRNAAGGQRWAPAVRQGKGQAVISGCKETTGCIRNGFTALEP